VRRLTYCSNIHPGPSWEDVRRNLESHALGVKRALASQEAFPLGVWLSAQALEELDEAAADSFGAWCDEQGLYVMTLNAFPHGRFHGAGVKEKVYLPDWRTTERSRYTRAAADRLVQWLPQGEAGSISTVPVAWAADFDEGDWPVVRERVIETLEHFDDLAQRVGRALVLAFEPEPGCVLETTEETLEFFDRLALPAGLAPLAGVCFDCCHQAVQYEDPRASFSRLLAAGIPIGKVQVSSALRARGKEIARLCEFDEPTYLHQVVARDRDGTLHRFADLPDFFAEEGSFARSPEAFVECRVHFHVPIFAETIGACGTTRFFLEELLPTLDPSVGLEVETYSFDVLPEALRKETVSESLVRELRWVGGIVDASNRRS
jgi:sugar phosphate isomerase/epimerase